MYTKVFIFALSFFHLLKKPIMSQIKNVKISPKDLVLTARVCLINFMRENDDNLSEKERNILVAALVVLDKKITIEDINEICQLHKN